MVARKSGDREKEMKLFDGGRAPNPRRVRVFLAEKGVEVPLVPVDMGAMEHRSEAATRRNPLRRLPVLELDDGTVLTESVAICRYFEELHPEPALFGRGALGKALVEMWQRRLEFNLFGTVAQAFRHIHPAMKEWEVPQVPEWGEANKPKAVEFLHLFDKELAGREFAAGDTYSIADITGLVAIDFMKPARIKVPEECVNVLRWHASVSSRPSAAA
jgi:glutathione S-transferase